MGTPVFSPNVSVSFFFQNSPFLQSFSKFTNERRKTMVKTTDEEMEALQKRTNQLSTEEIDEDDEENEEEETAPPSLMRKIVALKQLHEKCKEIDVEYKRERIALEMKYRELKKPVYANQGQIISGEVDVPAETEGPDATSEEVDDDMKGIPGYWAQALLSHPSIREIVTEEDVPALEALSDVQCEYNEDYTSFKLTFYFEENEFFENQVSPQLVHTLISLFLFLQYPSYLHILLTLR